VKVPVLVQLPGTDKVPEFAVIVPALMMFPFTARGPFIVRVAPELIVILLQTAPELPITGGVATTGMMTFVPASGTVCPHQLLATFQSELIFPSQVPATQVDPETVNVPVEAPK